MKNTYNEFGDLIRTEDVSTGIVEEKTYDSWGNVVQEINGNGRRSTKNFDANTGLLVSETAAGELTVNYQYNEMGLVVAKTVTGSNGDSQSTAFDYDSSGNLLKQTYSDGKFSSYEYDQAGNVTKAISIVDAAVQAITLYGHDLFNRLTSVTSPKGEITTYAYSPVGDLIEVKDPNNGNATFEYDSQRRLVKKVDSFGGVYTFTYDRVGNVIKEVDPKGQARQYYYDELNNVVKAQFPDDVIEYVYNYRNEVIKLSNNTSLLDYVRDSRNRVVETVVSGRGDLISYPTFSLAHSYDKAGNRVLLSSPIGSIGFSYDSLNRLTALQNSWGDSFVVGYDGVGRLRTLSRPGSRTDYTYTGNVLASMIHSSGGVTKSFVEYTYDQRNYPVSKRSPAGQVTYTYDANGQLTAALGAESPESFTYDALGNRIQDNTGTYSYGSASQRLLEDWQYRYSYDANGNLTQKTPKDGSKNAFVYSYSSKNQLVQIQVLESPLGQVIKQVNYSYDVLGRRMQKVVWNRNNQTDPKKTFTRRYVYDNQNILAEYNASNALLARYTHSPLMADDVLSAEISSNGAADGLAQTPGKFYYLKDALGTVTDIINASGTIVQRYDYEAFGKVRAVTNESGADITLSPVLSTSFAFTGREWDEEAGIYYYRARYYDPAIGRFLQMDPHSGKTELPISVVNKYSYVGNSPLVYKDPSGAIFGIDDLVIIGALAVIGAVDKMAQGEWALDKILGGALMGALAGALLIYLAPDLPAAGLFKGLTFKESFAITSAVSSAVKGSAKDGSFVENFFQFYAQDFGLNLGFATVGTILPSAIPEVYDYVIYPIYGIGAVSLYNEAAEIRCDPNTGGNPRGEECKR